MRASWSWGSKCRFSWPTSRGEHWPSTAARFYGRQPRDIVAVTGTNGKTSTVSFTHQLWRCLGLPAASIGTLGVTVDARGEGGGLTTPDPVRLHATLAELVSSGVEHVAMEASSHALDQRRLDGVVLRAAAFTESDPRPSRLSRDFRGLSCRQVASFRGAPAARRHRGPQCRCARARPPGGDRPRSRARGARLRPDGRTRCDFWISGRMETASISSSSFWAVAWPSTSPLVGGFQAANLLAAIGLVVATGHDRRGSSAASQHGRGRPRPDAAGGAPSERCCRLRRLRPYA